METKAHALESGILSQAEQAVIIADSVDPGSDQSLNCLPACLL